MGGGPSGGTSQQTTTQNVNPVLQPLFGQTAGTVAGLQPQIAGQFPEFFSQQPQFIPELTAGQHAIKGLEQYRAFGDPLTNWEYGAGNLAPQIGQQNTLEQMATQGAQGAASFTGPETVAAQRLYGGDILGGGFNPAEQAAASRLYGGDILGGGFNQAEVAALGQISQFAGGQIGQSPYTQAAMQAVRTPALNELAQAGLGNSDAIAATLGAQYAPILAQELQTRASIIPQLANLGQQTRAGALAATGQLGALGQQTRAGALAATGQLGALGQQQAGRALSAAGLEANLGQALRGGQTTTANLLSQLGATQAGRQSQLLSEYGQAEEAARQVQAQQGQAQLADLLRRQQLGGQFTTGILGGIPSVIGTDVVGKTKGGGGK